MDKLTRCEEAAGLLALYHYGELTAEEASLVEGHLAGCGRCADELAGIRRTLALVQAGLPAEADAARAKAAVMRRIAEPRKAPAFRLMPAFAAAALAVVVALALNFSGIFTRQPAPPPSQPVNGAVTASVDRELLENFELVSNLDLLEELDTLENMEEM